MFKMDWNKDSGVAVLFPASSLPAAKGGVSGATGRGLMVKTS
ncbi:MAG: hypothetical protein ACOY9Y_15810 [Bacillota bacterium]